MNYIIGNDNYNYYKSEDNGINWGFLKEGNGETSLHKGRIIIYSKENEGLKYTDDNFSTINNSNVLDGNWQALDNDEIDEIYSTSLDGKGIYCSKDNGETWEWISAGNGNKIEVTDDKIYIYGDNNDDDNDDNDDSDDSNNDISGNKKNVVEIPRDGRDPIFHPNSTLVNGKVVPNYIYGDTLVYILNNIILPRLCSTLTGYENLKDLNKFYNNESVYNNYYTDGEIYKVKLDGIDFATDVGMMPLKKEDVNEYKKSKEELENLIISYDKENKEIRLLETLDDKNSKLSKTFNIIDALLDCFKDEVLKKNIEKIKNKKEDYSGLTKAEDKDILNDYYKLSKTTEISITGTIINSIFSFSYSKKMALLKTSIMETANSLKGSINIKLNIAKDLINKQIIKDDKFVPMYTTEEIIKMVDLDFDLKEAWKASIKRCIDDYYRISRNNIINISKADDKEFISEAANEYSSVRIKLIEAVKEIVNNSMPTNFGLIDNTGRNTLLNNISDEILNNIKLLNNKKITEEEFNNNLDNLLQEFKEQENKMHIKEIPLYTCLANDYYNNFLNDFSSTNLDYLQNNTFNADTFEEFKAAYNSSDINKIYKYYQIIINEFKSRCRTLLEIVIKDLSANYPIQIDNYNNVSQYISRLKSAEDKLKYFNINPLSDYKYYHDTEKDFISVIKTSWNNIRNKI